MPIRSRDDAAEVEERIARIFGAPPEGRAAAVREMFVEALDFNPDQGLVSLVGAQSGVELPAAADRVAEIDGVHVLYVALDAPKSGRVNAREASAAAKLIADQIGEDLLLVFSNADASQLHFVHPDFSAARPTLRRMVVERDLPRRTAVQQVSNIYWSHRDTGSIREALEEAFDVEPVTKRFFAEYKRVFEQLEQGVSGFTAGEEEERRLFVQTLFNRLMFVYFLQRKGWLEFRGDKDYLKALWNDYRRNRGEADNFHVNWLQSLFFTGLNNPDSRDVTAGTVPLLGKVPFLNGGLFEQGVLDTRDGVTVPDEAIEAVLTGLFDRFNFTVMESTPFDIEVAVDPEMLGKVFEELVTGRHESGSYYTPRPVVSFMCREALKGYLEARETRLTTEAIAAFVDEQQTDGIDVAAARKVAGALSEVTVVDPACGSGAYLLGMMQELVELQTALFNAGADAKSLHRLKLEIIERNLYGVDIDEFAINIAMLRMWLSLAIDFEGDSPEPLPNLDFKVVLGDSLLGPDPSVGVAARNDPSAQVTLGRDPASMQELDRLKSEYMGATRTEDKKALKGRIAEIREDLRRAFGDASAIPDNCVDWRVVFAEVFARGGFDIAIANPPYVRYQQIEPTLKRSLKPLYGEATVGQSDLSCYFYLRALQLLRERGMHVFVSSNSWLDVAYGAPLQEYLLRSTSVRAIYESAVEKQFATADINTIISIVCNSSVEEDANTRFISLRAEFHAATRDPKLRREIVRSRRELLAAGSDEDHYIGDKWGGKFLRAPDIYHHIVEKVGSTRLRDIGTVRYGIITGADSFFYLTDETAQQWNVEPEFLVPAMRSPKESESIAVEPSALRHKIFVCHLEESDLRGARAMRYIRWGESQGFHEKSACRVRRRWYDIGNRVSARLAVNTLVGSTARAFLAREEILFDQKLYTVSTDPAVLVRLCAVLNSTYGQLALNIAGRTNFGGGLLRLAAYELANLPVPHPGLLPDLDDTIFAATQWDVMKPSAERQEIDGLVFDALGLTVGEREAVHEGVQNMVQSRAEKARSNVKAGTPP